MPPKRRRAPTTNSGDGDGDGSATTDQQRKRSARSSNKQGRPDSAPGASNVPVWDDTSLNPPPPKTTAPLLDDAADNDTLSFWLMKAEPESRIEKGKDVKFSIDDLAACKGAGSGWDGVRNYGARNNLRAMREGDRAFFYHSNCKTPGIVGIMTIIQEASVDETAFDSAEPYYDPKSSRDNPKWYQVQVAFLRKLARPIGLHELRKYANGELGKQLQDMPLLKQSRLSVSPVPKHCWDFILSLESQQPLDEVK